MHLKRELSHETRLSEIIPTKEMTTPEALRTMRGSHGVLPDPYNVSGMK
jgi:hypothetical protein